MSNLRSGFEVNGEKVEPKANLENVVFSNADLSRADLREANLRFAAFVNTNLRNADLSKAILKNADFTDAVLDGANLSDVSLEFAALNHANLKGAKYNDATHWPENFDPTRAGAVKIGIARQPQQTLNNSPKYFFAMGFPRSNNENSDQKALFAALQNNQDKAPVPITVYLLKTRSGRLLTVCEWPEERMAKIKEIGGLWGNSAVIRHWAEQANGPVYQDADILGPRTHDVQEVDGPSKILSAFTTDPAVNLKSVTIQQNTKKWWQFWK